MSGWTTGQMVSRWNQAENSDVFGVKGMGLEYALEKKQFDLVCIMAGTNDLGSVETEKIEENLLKLHKKVHERDIKTLAIGIPESGFSNQAAGLSEKREKINNCLRNKALTLKSQMHFMENPVKFNKDNFASDGLHFSKAGYEVLGNNVRTKIEEIFQ
eukprot:TRINITY_DN61512_c0_g1_i1.p1 TRINITY_DN61512_c0_g1~~TRINITY_DN61512_c0_g1_i1.p1  ORF type:complete len:158 (-),score=39.02 TRINITY_DN61512_c0_g1_i1:2-475(-)